jgi:2-polyprenyl-3-methyl-5-hydroxy-6-metoxy-1,4-benzoquinol methylase
VKNGSALPGALDIACGAGRNSLYLAAQGYQVF